MTVHGLPTIVRFMLHVTQDDKTGCWEWTGFLDKKGYASFGISGKKVGAHRAAYELIVGRIPDGLHLDHLCRNHACVNPRHLEPVTQAENIRRGARASMTHCSRGHEFTPENTRITRETRSGGFSRVCRACRREDTARRRAANK